MITFLIICLVGGSIYSVGYLNGKDKGIQFMMEHKNQVKLPELSAEEIKAIDQEVEDVVSND